MGSGPSDKTWEPAVAEGNVLYKRGSDQQGAGSAAEAVQALVLDVKRVVSLFGCVCRHTLKLCLVKHWRHAIAPSNKKSPVWVSP